MKINLAKFKANDLSDEEIIYTNLEGYSLYRIFNEVNNKSYIGSTCRSITSRFFHHASAHFTRYEKTPEYNTMYEDMHRLGLDKFYVERLEFNGQHDEAYFIEKFDSFNNGYNRNKNGYAGSYIISELIWINNPNTGHKTRVHEEDLQYYLDEGYVYGQGKQDNSNGLNGARWMYNERMNLYARIQPSDISEFEKTGWVFSGGSCNGTKWMHKGDESHRVREEDIQAYLNDGYEFGRGTSWIY